MKPPEGIPSLDDLPIVVRRTTAGLICSAAVTAFWTVGAITAFFAAKAYWDSIPTWLAVLIIFSGLYALGMAALRSNEFLGYRLIIDGSGMETGGLLYRVRFSWDEIDGMHVWNAFGPFNQNSISFVGKGHKPPMSHQGWSAWAYRSPNALLLPGLMTLKPEVIAVTMKRARSQWLAAGDNRRAELASDV